MWQQRLRSTTWLCAVLAVEFSCETNKQKTSYGAERIKFNLAFFGTTDSCLDSDHFYCEETGLICLVLWQAGRSADENLVA